MSIPTPTHIAQVEVLHWQYMKNVTIGAIIIMLLGVAAFAYYTLYIQAPEAAPVSAEVVQQQPVAAEPAPTPIRAAEVVIGKSVESRDILAYHFGADAVGVKELLVVGGIHGSYSANTTKVAQEAVEWLKANPTVIPAGVSVTVIPNVNPDGLVKPNMRFNANNVDLNRNFDCDWAATSMWQNKKVSGGTAAFSEPEAKSVQNFVETYKPAASVVFFSSEGEVYPSGCGEVLPASQTLASLYASSSGYHANTTDFSHYKITGDMVNWMAKMNIPAISVLLSNHTDTEWAKNEKGLTAVLNSLAQ